MSDNPCKCIEEIDAELEELTLDIAICFSGSNLVSRTYSRLLRKDNGKPESRSRKPRVFAHTFCPFCGTRYEPKPVTSAELAKLGDDPEIAASVNEQGGGRAA